MSVAATARLATRAPLQRWLPGLPWAAIERIQGRRVRAVVHYAHEHVPYYRDVMRKAGLSPADIEGASDLARLPMIERHQLQADPEYFVAQGVSRRDWVTLASGGSTGRPVSVMRDPRSALDTAIHAQRARSLIARRLGSFRFREAVFVPGESSGGTLDAALRSSSMLKPELRGPRLPLSLFDPPAAHVDALEEFRPEVYAGYGSYIEAMFAHADATGRPAHRPQVVTYAADQLSDEMRARIAERGISIFSTYQSIEGGQTGFECERHDGFHVNADFCPLRIESGEVVISDLTNRATVLLNYRLGDVAEEMPACACGITLPKISFLRGRTRDWLKLASGESVHPQTASALIRKELEVLQYQVVQVEVGRFELRLVTAEGCDRAALGGRLERGFRERFDADVDLRFVDEIPRTKAGKLRPVICLVD